MQKMAESLTEVEYWSNLAALKSHTIWKKSPKLQRYIEAEWLRNDKYKVKLITFVRLRTICSVQK